MPTTHTHTPPRSLPGLSDAAEDLRHARYNLAQDEVFFWSWREPYKHTVPGLRAEVKKATAAYAALDMVRTAQIRKAKNRLGLFSDLAVSETRCGLGEGAH